jgi:hypothetical protein
LEAIAYFSASYFSPNFFLLMTASETAILESGQRVGLVVVDYPNELADFGPLAAANDERAEVVAAIEAKESAQDTETESTTTAKEEARELMARTADTLSARAVGYALATRQLGLQQQLTLTYHDVRYGEATEDVNAVRELVARVRALPEEVRTLYRLTKAVIEAPETAAKAFEETADAQTGAKAAPRLATLALPELIRRLSASLQLMKTLLKGQRYDTDKNFKWGDFYAAFGEADKRRKVAAKRRPTTSGPRIVRTLVLTAPDGQRRLLGRTKYAPTYTLTAENRSGTDLRLWMAQKDGAPTTPVTCPAGVVTTVTRADLGPETARYLMAQFGGDAGGQATVVVRRVAAE